MNRRLFLSLLAGAALDPERLLWVPRRRVISVPKRFGMSTALPPAVLDFQRWMNRINSQLLEQMELMNDHWVKTQSGVYLNGQLTPHHQIPIVEVKFDPPPWSSTR